MAKILLPALLRRYTGDVAEVEVPAGTVGEALEGLFAQYPELRARMIDRRGRIRRHVLPFRSEAPMPRQDYADLPLEATDSLRFMVAISGG